MEGQCISELQRHMDTFLEVLQKMVAALVFWSGAKCIFLSTAEWEDIHIMHLG